MTTLAQHLPFKQLFERHEDLDDVALSCDRHGRWRVALTLGKPPARIVHCAPAASPDEAIQLAIAFPLAPRP